MAVHLKFYSLSTCIWCRKTRQYLKEIGVEYDETAVDLLSGDEREKAVKELEKYNPSRSFPTLVFDKGRKVVVGYKPDEIREALNP